MNLQDLTKKHLTQFCEKFDCSLDEFKHDRDDSYYLRMFSGVMGPSPEFVVTKDYCIGINYYEGYNLTNEWLEFLSELENNKEKQSEQAI